MTACAQLSSDQIADLIMSFVRGAVRENTSIVLNQAGLYEIETCMGSSFMFEITGVTREEVARAYLAHCIEVTRGQLLEQHGLFARLFMRDHKRELEDRLKLLLLISDTL